MPTPISASTGSGPKGLPGFLRRSLRMNEEEEEEEDESSNGAGTLAAGGRQSKSDHGQDDQTPPLSPAVGPRGTVNMIPPTPQTTPVVTKEVKTVSDEKQGSETSTESYNSLVEEPIGTITASSSLSLSIPQVATTAKPTGPLERQISYKERQFELVIEADVVSMAELRRLSWNGIPPHYRGQAWKIMLGYVPVNKSRRTKTIERKRAEYRDAILQHYDIDDDTRTIQEQETLRQVLVDVPRTAPEIGLFRKDKVRRALTRLLYIWAMRHPASSYVQGINDLVTPLIVVFLSDYFEQGEVLDGHIMAEVSQELMNEVEADCYWCLTNLLAGIQDHYTSDQPGVQRMVMRLEELVNRIDSALCEYLRGVGIEFIQFAFKWMNCLLLREFNLPCVIRLWDTYISEGDGGFEDFHVYVCAAFLCQFSSQLQAMEFDELFGFMQSIPTSDWSDVEVEILLSQAYVLSTLFGGSDAHLTSTKAASR